MESSKAQHRSPIMVSGTSSQGAELAPHPEPPSAWLSLLLLQESSKAQHGLPIMVSGASSLGAEHAPHPEPPSAWLSIQQLRGTGVR
ncbi:UNVERIFIED_CONTAM: hypothetical protein K2H54_028365 [Gekko kuhli]